jgi:mRNA interferase RelE/StbE
MTNWSIRLSETAKKQLQKLDKPIQRRISAYLNERLSTNPTPKALATRLAGTINDLWRFRVGDYRLICEIQDETVTILVLRIAHRKEVYDAI